MIKLLLLDVDGTLTDGKITLIENGKSIMEAKSFNIKDGLGIVAWLKMGKEVAIISGRESASTRTRAEELGITRVFLGVEDKASTAQKIISGLNVQKNEVACIGDDVNDLGLFAQSGMSFAPSNANAYIKKNADIVLNARGGEGAVREMIDFIISRDEKEQAEFLAMYQKSAK